MQVSSTVVQSISDAAAASAHLIERCVDEAVAKLQQAESHASGEQRQALLDAWRALLVHRGPWSKRLPRLLAAAFEAEASGQPQNGGSARDTQEEPTLSGMSLVDDTELSRTIEAARLAQQLAAVLERPLAELDALMSSALGLEGVQPERNPLRPAVYAQVLRDLMAEDKPDPALPALWLRHMTKPLAEQLAQVYREQAHYLTLQRVHAATYRMRAGASPSRPAPLGPASGPPSFGAPSGPAPLGPAAGPADRNGAHSGFADLPLQDVEPARLQQFLMRGEPQASRPLGPSYYAQVQAELRELEARRGPEPAYDAAALRQQMHVPAVDRAPRPIDTDSPLPQEVWGRFSAPRERALVRGRLKTQAREVGQVYGLEVVRRLVNRVADDPRLLGPLREAIVGLEPALLRLAMVAPRFFSDAEHPGRLLVERVAERSFKYNDEFSVEFQGFFGPVAQSFLRLNQIDPLESADPFRTALGALEAAWAAQDALDEEAQRQVLEAVQFAERRQHEAERIAADLRQRPDLEGVADAVRDFVLGPWALVIAHARLTQAGAGGIDPGGHLAVVSDLLWSVKRDLALHDPARAFVLIPGLLTKLRAGLAMLGQQPQESAPFFHELEALHRPVLKLLAKKRHVQLAPAEPPRAAAAAAPARAPDELWMAPQEMHAAGFDDKQADGAHGHGHGHGHAHGHAHTHAHAHSPAQDDGHAPGSGQAAARDGEIDEREAERVVERLTPGSWVDLYSRQQWRRARLKWTSDKRTLFLFVSHGGRPHSMTRRSIERLVRDRLLRPVDGGAVVPRALAQLGQPAAPAAA